MHRFCSSLTNFSSTKKLQTRFVAPHKPSIDIFLVIKVIISNDKFIAIYTVKKFGARFSFSDFHRQKGPVKLIKRVKIAHSFLQSVSNQFHVIILNLPM